MGGRDKRVASPPLGFASKCARDADLWGSHGDASLTLAGGSEVWVYAIDTCQTYTHKTHIYTTVLAPTHTEHTHTYSLWSFGTETRIAVHLYHRFFYSSKLSSVSRGCGLLQSLVFVSKTTCSLSVYSKYTVPASACLWNKKAF